MIEEILYRICIFDQRHIDGCHLMYKSRKGYFSRPVEFMDKNNGASIANAPLVFNEGLVYDMPHNFDWSIPKKSSGKISALKNFWRSCLALIKYEYSLKELTALTEEPEEDI